MAPASLLGEVYAAVTDCVRELDEEGLAAPTRTDWTVAELVFHLLLDAQRTLVALATPADQPPDTDAVSYWHDWNPGSGDGGAAHARFVRAAAAAYSSPCVIVDQWTETAAAAVHAARTAPPDEVVLTQGHRLAVPDFLSTLVVEGAVHLLDLAVHVPGPPVPPQALAEVRRVLDGLLGSRVPAGWDDTTYALKGTGRLPLGDADRAALGRAADRFPLLG
jgi:hypothetical protein